jgi:hypothetical protein
LGCRSFVIGAYTPPCEAFHFLVAIIDCKNILPVVTAISLNVLLFLFILRYDDMTVINKSNLKAYHIGMDMLSGQIHLIY